MLTSIALVRLQATELQQRTLTTQYDLGSYKGSLYFMSAKDIVREKMTNPWNPITAGFESSTEYSNMLCSLLITT